MSLATEGWEVLAGTEFGLAWSPERHSLSWESTNHPALLGFISSTSSHRALENGKARLPSLIFWGPVLVQRSLLLCLLDFSLGGPIWSLLPLFMLGYPAWLLRIGSFFLLRISSRSRVVLGHICCCRECQDIPFFPFETVQWNLWHEAVLLYLLMVCLNFCFFP